MIGRRAFLASLAAASLPGHRRAEAISEQMLEAVVDGLDRPRSFVFLPEGAVLVTEARALRSVGRNRKISEPIAGLPDVMTTVQGGLHNIILHPSFAQSRLIFLSFSEPRGGAMTSTGVMRGKLSDNLRSLTDVKIIFRQQPCIKRSDCMDSRLVFDRSGALFATIDECSSVQNLGQGPNYHFGKIIRITENGGVPPDNPKGEGWRPETWSIGHHSLKCVAIHPETGRLWTVEQGVRGGDVLNLPEAGANYGWSDKVTRSDHSSERISTDLEQKGRGGGAVHYWEESIAPSSMTFYSGERYPQWKGNLFIGSLAQKRLLRIVVENGQVVQQEPMYEGRVPIRDVRQGPDGYMYILTDQSAPMGRVMRVTP